MDNTTQVETPANTIKLHVAIPYMMFTVCSIMINFTVLAASVKVLKRSLHNILVLLMCFGDGLNGVIVLWFAVLALLPSIQNGRICIFTLFAGSFTSLINPCLVFMISAERYLVVRRLNIGVQEKLNRYKYWIVAAAILFPFLVSLIVLIVPHSTQNQTCFPQDVFGEYYATYVYVIYGTVTVLDVAIIILSLTTSMMIWKMFLKPNTVGTYKSHGKNNVLSSARTREPCSSACTRKPCSIRTKNQRLAANSETIENKTFIRETNINVERNTDSPRPVPMRTKTVTSTMLETNETDLPEVETMKNATVNMVSRTPVQDGVDSSDNAEKRTFMSQSRCTGMTHVNVKDINEINEACAETEDTSHIETAKNSNQQNVRRTSLIPKDQQKISWEVRAFTINLMIAISTILLTGPFVVLFWLQVSNIQISTSVKFSLNILCLINYTLDPILYVLGFQEIKNKIRQMNPCRQRGEDN